MYELSLPKDDEQPDNVVVAEFGGPEPVPAAPADPDEDDTSQGWLAVVAKAEVLPRLEQWVDDAVVGEGVFGQRPASVAALVRQYFIDPPQFVREAIGLRILYGLYGIPVVLVNVTTQTLLLIIRYPSLLAATVVIAGVIYLVSFILEPK